VNKVTQNKRCSGPLHNGNLVSAEFRVHKGKALGYCVDCEREKDRLRRERKVRKVASAAKAAVQAVDPGNFVKVPKAWPKCWQLAYIALSTRRCVLLYGPPGTGKTTAGSTFGVTQGVTRVVNLTVEEEMPVAELRGHPWILGGDTVWKDGPGTDVFTNGGRLVVNELSSASGAVLGVCNALFDGPEHGWTLPTGETRFAHPDYSAVGTMNGEPGELTEALQDRFGGGMVKITEPHPDAIASLPADLRQPARNSCSDRPEEHIGFRTWKAFAELREVCPVEDAAAIAFGDRADVVRDTMLIAGSHGGTV